MAEEQQSEAELPPLKIDETERIIARLEQVVRDRRVVLVGGQAVAVWASKLEDRIADTLVEAVASRDIDLLGNCAPTLTRPNPMIFGYRRYRRVATETPTKRTPRAP